MNSSSSSEDEHSFEYWKDWRHSKNQSNFTLSSSCERKKNCFEKQLHVYEKSWNNGIKDNPEFGNWVAPINFIKTQRNLQKSQPEHNFKNKPKETEENYTFLVKKDEIKENKVCWIKKLNVDWGERVNLYNVSSLLDGDVVWDMINAGIFAQIKLWSNEYNHVCGSAEGTLSKLGSPEKSSISITNLELLRKMLNISKPHWTFLIGMVEKNKQSLKFEAWKEFDIHKHTSLEKLWFFLCKRRHLFPDQCMLVKLSGALKCMKEFKIIPKLIVLDIRNNYSFRNDFNK